MPYVYGAQNVFIGPAAPRGVPDARALFGSSAKIGSLISTGAFTASRGPGGPPHRRARKRQATPPVATTTTATTCPTCSAATLAKHPLFGPGGPDPKDVQMSGTLGDCALMGELISIASTRPDILEDMIVPLGDGKYRVTFPTRPPKVVEVTESVPSSPDGNPTNAGFGSTGAKWPMILQNAYAKAFFGDDYSKMQGMHPVEVLENITGMPVTYGKPSERSFDEFQKMMSNGAILTAGLPIHQTGPGGKEKVDAHLFSINKFFVDAAGVQQVTLTNAWGAGPAGVDPNWKSNQRSFFDWLLGTPDFKMPTGTSTIPFSDFQRGFEQYTVQQQAPVPTPFVVGRPGRPQRLSKARALPV